MKKILGLILILTAGLGLQAASLEDLKRVYDESKSTTGQQVLQHLQDPVVINNVVIVEGLLKHTGSATYNALSSQNFREKRRILTEFLSSYGDSGSGSASIPPRSELTAAPVVNPDGAGSGSGATNLVELERVLLGRGVSYEALIANNLEDKRNKRYNHGTFVLPNAYAPAPAVHTPAPAVHTPAPAVPAVDVPAVPVVPPAAAPVIGAGPNAQFIIDEMKKLEDTRLTQDELNVIITKEEEKLAKFAKLLRLGQPAAQIKLRMVAESLLPAAQKRAPAPAPAPAPVPAPDAAAAQAAVAGGGGEGGAPVVQPVPAVPAVQPAPVVAPAAAPKQSVMEELRAQQARRAAAAQAAVAGGGGAAVPVPAPAETEAGKGLSAAEISTQYPGISEEGAQVLGYLGRLLQPDQRNIVANSDKLAATVFLIASRQSPEDVFAAMQKPGKILGAPAPAPVPSSKSKGTEAPSDMKAMLDGRLAKGLGLHQETPAVAAVTSSALSAKAQDFVDAFNDGENLDGKLKDMEIDIIGRLLLDEEIDAWKLQLDTLVAANDWGEYDGYIKGFKRFLASKNVGGGAGAGAGAGTGGVAGGGGEGGAPVPAPAAIPVAAPAPAPAPVPAPASLVSAAGVRLPAPPAPRPQAQASAAKGTGSAAAPRPLVQVPNSGGDVIPMPQRVASTVPGSPLADQATVDAIIRKYELTSEDSANFQGLVRRVRESKELNNPDIITSVDQNAFKKPPLTSNTNIAKAKAAYLISVGKAKGPYVDAWTQFFATEGLPDGSIKGDDGSGDDVSTGSDSSL